VGISRLQTDGGRELVYCRVLESIGLEETTKTWAGGVVKVVERLPSKREARSSNLSTGGKKVLFTVCIAYLLCVRHFSWDTKQQQGLVRGHGSPDKCEDYKTVVKQQLQGWECLVLEENKKGSGDTYKDNDRR
jgi:hypothetical protein